MSIKQKTISGLKWSFTDNLVNQVVHFVVGIILARLLSPTEYGIIGMTMIFIAVSQIFVTSGLKDALIRKQNCTQADYCTMFYTNIGIGVLAFVALFFLAKPISRFYNNADLVLLVRVMALNLVINSFGMVEKAKLTRRIDFKRQTKISLIANISSGIIGISMAYLGYGYWSLAIKTLCQNMFTVVLLHSFSNWKPSLLYSAKSFKELFGFGVKLLAAGLINTIYKNIYKLVIAKYFSPEDLGFYSRAEQFKNLPSANLEQTTSRVTYPVLSSMVGDKIKLKRGYKKLIKLSFYITSFVMLLMLINSREIVLILIGEKWSKTIDYLKIICISGAFYPLHAINLNMLKALGRSDLFLRLEIIKKIMVVPVIIVAIQFGMIALIWGLVINSFAAYIINSMYSAKLLQYSTLDQLKDIAPTFLHILIMAGFAFAMGTVAPSHLFLSLIMKTGVAVLYMVGAGFLFKIPEFMEIKSILCDQVIYHYSVIKNRKRHVSSQYR